MNALTVIPPQSHVPAFSMSDMERIALAIAKGGLFGSKDPNAVLTLCMLAQAEGQHPAVVFRDYHLISGKPAKKAEAMQRDFLAAGGKIEWHALTDDCADATFSHPMGGSARISWDKARVKQAQLGGNAMHAKYPRQMLRARVLSEGVRTVFPGATSGMYVPEEIQDFTQSPPPAAEPTRSGSITAPLTGAALLAQAAPEDRPSEPRTSPDAAAGEPPNDSAGQPEAAPSSNLTGPARWQRDFLALVAEVADRAALVDLQFANATTLAKLERDDPGLHAAATAAILARLDEFSQGEAHEPEDGDTSWRGNLRAAG